MRCYKLNIKEIQLTADIVEFQKKCQLLQTENKLLRTKIQKCTTNAIRLGQIIRLQRCHLCSSSMTAEQLREHLCVGLTEIACEHCTDAKFTSTLAMSEHFASDIHVNMKFQKCSKCTLCFPISALLEIHEKGHEQHSGAIIKTSEYTIDQYNELLELKLIFVCKFKCSNVESVMSRANSH